MAGLICSIPDWWTDDFAQLSATMLQAALSEAGYPRDVEIVDSAHSGIRCGMARNVPTPVFNRARSLVYLRTGIPFEWCSTCPDWWFSSKRRHWSECPMAEDD